MVQRAATGTDWHAPSNQRSNGNERRRARGWDCSAHPLASPLRAPRYGAGLRPSASAPCGRVEPAPSANPPLLHPPSPPDTKNAPCGAVVERGIVRLIPEPHPCALRATGPACGRPRPLPADASNRRLLRTRRFSTHPLRQIRKTPLAGRFSYLAERVGFEPTLRHNRKPDFESGAFDHSATSP